MHARRGTVQLKDEVYRQMFRLEEGRPGAEIGLAVALLQALIAGDSKPQCTEARNWLKKISPICLQMIEASLKTNVTALPYAH
ncbi:MAG: hypothetical protein ABSE55_08730 [Terracidiphilus sp.]|jgi:hypothetical protein